MKCSTKNCKNPSKGRKLCASCRSRKARKKNPIRYAYNCLKSNAKRRGRIFELTFKFFKEFCKKTNYIKLKGMGPDDMTIDRKVSPLGYIDGNIRMISRSANAMKDSQIRDTFWEDYYAEVGFTYVPEPEEIIDPNKVPF